MVADRSLSEEWEGQAQAWVRWTRTPGHDHHFERYNWPEFLKLLPAPGRATLDLGCGEGRVGVVLNELGHRVTGVDSAPSLRDLAAGTGAYRDVISGDAASLPFADQSFDLIVAFMSLQDMDDAPAAVVEAARVLTPGGRFVAAFVHPFASAHLGREATHQRSYFEVQRTLDEVERDGISFSFHQIHRPLHGWLKLFFDAGFVIEDTREPRPSEQDAAADPELAKTRARPAFLHLRARLAGAA